MKHPIADALTCHEKNHVISLLCWAIQKNDYEPNMQTLMREIHELAYGAPDDSGWPNYGEVRAPEVVE